MIQDPLCWDARVLMSYIIIHRHQARSICTSPLVYSCCPDQSHTLSTQRKIWTIVQHPILDLFHHIPSSAYSSDTAAPIGLNRQPPKRFHGRPVTSYFFYSPFSQVRDVGTKQRDKTRNNSNNNNNNSNNTSTYAQNYYTGLR